MDFFNHRVETNPQRPVYDWGTADLQNSKFDPTLIKSPTFLLKYIYACFIYLNNHDFKSY